MVSENTALYKNDRLPLAKLSTLWASIGLRLGNSLPTPVGLRRTIYIVRHYPRLPLLGLEIESSFGLRLNL